MKKLVLRNSAGPLLLWNYVRDRWKDGLVLSWPEGSFIALQGASVMYPYDKIIVHVHFDL